MLTKAALEKGLIHLLRPIIRLCVRYGVKIHQVELEIKKLFVQEAKLFLEEARSERSASRISVMTGMQRPAVSDFMNEQKIPMKQSLVSKVVGSWSSKTDYVTKSGSPRVLEVEGKESEFAKLVHSVSQALNPYTVLFELERAKLIERSAKGVRLLTQAFNSKYDIDQSIQYLASDISDLTFAVEENISAEGRAPNHHITTEYDNIPLNKVAQIQSCLMKEGDSFHRKMRNYLSKFDRDIGGDRSNSKSVRVSISSFSRCEVGE